MGIYVSTFVVFWIFATDLMANFERETRLGLVKLLRMIGILYA